MNFSRTVTLGLGLAAAVMLLGLRPAAADVTIDAGYVNDSPTYVFHNNGPDDLTQIVFTGSGPSPGYETDNQYLPDLLAGTSYTVTPGPIARFHGGDPDDFGINRSYLLSVSAYRNGNPVPVFAIFQPEINSTGSYVDFEGLTTDADFAPVQVATVKAIVYAPAPEPAQTASLGFVGLGLGGVMLMGRRKKARNPA